MAKNRLKFLNFSIHFKTHNMKKLILIFAFFAGILISCDAKKTTSESNGSNPDMLNGSWELNYIAQTKMAVNDIYPDKKPFIAFNTKESKVSGNTGCNSFSGAISSMSNGKIRFDEAMVMTRMFCPGDGENVFVQNMKTVESFSFSDDGKTLHLVQKSGVDAMRLTKK